MLALTVLEVADAWTGPLAGLLLSDFGARVIKIEPPEWKRSLEVRIAQRDDPIFLAGNRGKKSVVLDLTLRQGREIFEGLISVFAEPKNSQSNSLLNCSSEVFAIVSVRHFSSRPGT